MWADSDYAPSRGSFLRPVAPPVVDPTTAPTITITISCAWLPFIRGALQQLLLQATWQGDAPTLLEAQQRAFNLIDLFQECATVDFPFACSYEIEVDGAGWECQVRPPSSTPSCASVLVPGSGFVNVDVTDTGTPGRTYGIAECELSFTPTLLTEVVMGYDLIKGNFDVDDGNQTLIVIRLAGVNVAVQSVHSAADPDGSGKAFGWVGSLMADNVIFLVQCSNRISGTMAGSAIIRTAELNGVGPTPCGSG